MYLCGIDPGTTQSAIVVVNSELTRIFMHGKFSNDVLLSMIKREQLPVLSNCDIAIERPTPYGKKVGTETFDTIWFGGFLSGVIYKEYGVKPVEISRKKVLGTLLHDTSCKNPDKLIRDYIISLNIVQATQKKKSIKYEIVKDEWAALAVAVALKKIKCN
jgi:hypothetical protein